MDKDQIAKNNTCEVLEEYVNDTDNAAIIITNGTMQEDKETFLADKVLLDEQIAIALIDPVGIAQNEMDAKAAVSKYVFDVICAPSHRYALKVGDHDLQHTFKHTESMLFNYALTALGPIVKNVLDKALWLKDNVPAYVVSTSMTVLKIDGGTTLNNAYKGWLGKPKLAIKTKNAALHQIDVIQKRIFEVDFKLLLDDSTVFNVAHPDLRPGLITAMRIDDLPSDHDGIEGYGHDENGEVLVGMTVTNIDMPDRPPMVANNVGFYHDDTFIWGTYRYKYEYPGKVSQTKTVTIARGEVVVVNVVLLPTPPPPPPVV